MWRRNFEFGAACGPSYANGVVYFNTVGGGLHAVDSCTGEQLINVPIVGIAIGSVTISNGVVYFGDVLGVYAYSLDGQDSCGSKSAPKSVDSQNIDSCYEHY